MKIGKLIGTLAALIGIAAGVIAIYEFYNKSPLPDPIPQRSRPSILSFQASPSIIKAGGKTTLNWSVEDASSVNID